MQEIYKNATTALEGPVDFRHTFVDMTNVNVTTVNGTKVRMRSLASLL